MIMERNGCISRRSDVEGQTDDPFVARAHDDVQTQVASPRTLRAGRLPYRILDRGVDIVVLLWLFILSEAVIPLTMLQHQDDFSDEQKLFLQNLLKPFVVFAFFLLLLSFKNISSMLIRNPFIVFIAIWMWLSAFWSMDQDITVRRSLVHSSFMIIACFIALRYDFRELVIMLFTITCAVVVSSIYFIVADPSLGFNPDGRGARGAFMHKNTLANFLVVGIAVAGSALRLRIVPRLVGYSVLISTLALLVLANSTSAFLTVVVMFGVYVLMELRSKLSFRLMAVFLAFSMGIVIFGALLLIVRIDEIFSLLGRDMTLTGRDEVWHYAGRMVQERVLLGYGYSAFWETEPILSYVTETLKWHITHAHNGFLQMWLELGLVGVGLMVAFLAVSVWRAAFSSLPDHFALLALPFFIAMIVNDFVETHLFVYRHFGWIIMLILIFLTTPGLQNIRNRPQTMSDLR